MGWLVVFGGVLLVGGVWGTFAGKKTRGERWAAASELACLAALAVVGLALLRQFSDQEWAIGVATGFLSVAVYDLARKLPELIRSTAGKDEVERARR
jgi:hypothetical protein